ncbi:MAG TPA: hypothetical protein VGE37_02275 [Archangium sp.]
MGIIKQGRDAVQTEWQAWQAANPTANRDQKRKFLAAMSNAVNELLAKRDAQDNSAPGDFAASRQAQFKTFTDALPEPTLDPIDPSL